MKKKWEERYFVTAVASVPIYKGFSKTETYRQAAKPGWGTVEWYSAADGYKNPVTRDRNDKTQQLCCDEDCSADLYTKNGGYFGIHPYEEIDTTGGCQRQRAGSQTAWHAVRRQNCAGKRIPGKRNRRMV